MKPDPEPNRIPMDAKIMLFVFALVLAVAGVAAGYRLMMLIFN